MEPMDLMIFIPLLFALQTFYWYIGRRSATNVNTNEDYFLAGKSVRFFPLMMTFLATQVGGGLVLGSAEEAYRYGWAVLLYPLGAGLGLIGLGLGIGRRLAEFPVSTVAQILEIVYRSSLLRRLASLLSILSLFMVLVGQIIASSKFLASLGLTSGTLFCLFWAIVILYTMKGGLKAVISTDIVQALVFTLAFFLCFAIAYTSGAGDSFPIPQWDTFSFASSKLCGWLFMPLLFMLIEQDMAQRCFAGGSPKIVSRAAFWAGVGTFLIPIVPIFFGVLAKTMGLQAAPGASILLLAIEKTTNPWITALAGCAILAAVVSTATSLINAISSNLSTDFFQKENLKLTKTLTATISIAAIAFAFYFDNIVDILIQSYDLSLSCLCVPILTALFKRKGNFFSALLSIVFGAVAFTLFRIYPPAFPRELASIALSALGFLIGELLARTRQTSIERST